MDTFRDLSKQWADESQAFKALYSLNKVRVPWIKDSISKDKETLIGSRIADIGCGGGLLSIPLARLGADVSGIDANPEAIESARLSLKRSPQLRGSLEYVCTNVTDFAAKNESSFDAVVASEIIEHVADVGSFIDACVRLARPGASIFFTTINKTLMSKLLAVWMAEDVLQIVPEGVHDWNKFMEPELLCQELESRGCEMRFSHGLIYNPMLNEWAWSPSKLMNYAVTAVKI
uniref:Ubiquinone biosynthesis O-methyltransferase, mitochondrial n=1 Tax=Steinernema glaseri TaxID=37863 RepID=A0A1I7YZE7_9BILA